MSEASQVAIAIPRKELGTRAEARNAEVIRCLRMNPKHILFLDTDQTMPHKGWTALLAESADIAVIDTPPHGSDTPNVMFNPDGTICYCTMACSLIRADVFKKLDPPWFSSAYNYQPRGVKDGKIILDKLEKYHDNNQGEDIYFIRNAIEAGLSIKVVRDMKCRHWELGDI